MVKALLFPCREHGFKPGPGTKNLYMPCGKAKEKKRKTLPPPLIGIAVYTILILDSKFS